MKLKQGQFSSQLLIIALAGILMVLMIQMAKAQTTDPLVANNSQQQQQNRALERTQGQTISIGMPQKTLGRRILENTTLNYYHQFLGPTASGSSTETYNVFQSSATDPRSGRAPLQSFQSMNLRHQLGNSGWAFGATLAAVNGYTDEVTNRDGATVNKPSVEFFNARAYVTLPSFSLPGVTVFSTIAYEAPTSSISKEDQMRFGWVITENFSFKLPGSKWSAGILGQVYRTYYKNNQTPVVFSDGTQCLPQFCIPNQLQTLIVSGGPYVNYAFTDRWQFNSLITMDWDQRGIQSGSRDLNNNLPHRARAGVAYFPQKIKYLTSVGLFAQGLLKYRPDTTAIGADFGLRF